MSKKKILIKISIVAIILGVLLVIFGFILNLFSSNIKNSASKSEKVPQSLKDNLITNSSKKLLKKHCLDDFCILKMDNSFIKESNNGSIVSTIRNESSHTFPAGFVHLNFQTNGKEVVLVMYYPEIKAGEKTKAIVNYLDEDIVYADDYQLSYPSPDELAEYEKNLVS